jgi:hypothetical protein
VRGRPTKSRWDTLKFLSLHKSVALQGLKRATVASGICRAGQRFGMKFSLKETEEGILITRIK